MSSNVKGVDSGKIRRMKSKKSHSWWWDSHISPKNSKWLADNLEETDRSVNEMLKLIYQEEGDSFVKKAEMCYQKRPELISYVEDFYRNYRALAEHYYNLIVELRKNIQSELSSEPPSPLLPSLDCTPETKPKIPIRGRRAAGIEIFLGSGGSSDLSTKGSDGFFSSSGSDFEDNDDDVKSLNGDDGLLHQRILELENEICVVKDKLHEHDCGKLANLDHAYLSSKISALESDLLVANEKIQVSEAEIVSLLRELKEKNLSAEFLSAELSNENMVVSKLEARVVELETEIEGTKNEIEHLKGVISSSDLSVEHLKIQLGDASDKFTEEKIILQIDVANLEGVVNGLNADVGRISLEKVMLETSISKLQRRVNELTAAAAVAADRFSGEKSSLEAEISNLLQSNAYLEEKLFKLEADKNELFQQKDEQMAELSASLGSLKEKVRMLIVERDELNGRAGELYDDIRCRDDREGRMSADLQEQQMENAKLVKEIEELEEEVEELEEVVDRQRVALSDGAEGKREVIRQLCFSMEHYRDRYHLLLQVMQGNSKWPSAVTAN